MLFNIPIFCMWILEEFKLSFEFVIPNEIIMFIVSFIKIKTKIINDYGNLLIIHDKSVGIFDPTNNKFIFQQFDWFKKVFSNNGTTYVISKMNDIYKYDFTKIYRERFDYGDNLYTNGARRSEKLQKFLKTHEIKGIKKVYCETDMKIILTDCNKIVSIKSGTCKDYLKLLSISTDKSHIKKIAISAYYILVLTATTIHCFKRDILSRSDDENIVICRKLSVSNIIKIKMTMSDIFLLDINDDVFHLCDYWNGCPEEMKIIRSNIIKMYCSAHYCFFLTKNNELYAHGYNATGILGVGHYNHCSYLSLQQTKLQNVISVYGASNHCTALTVDGRIYMWGNIWECKERSVIKINNDIPRYSNVPIEVFRI